MIKETKPKQNKKYQNPSAVTTLMELVVQGIKTAVRIREPTDNSGSCSSEHCIRWTNHDLRPQQSSPPAACPSAGPSTSQPQSSTGCSPTSQHPSSLHAGSELQWNCPAEESVHCCSCPRPDSPAPCCTLGCPWQRTGNHRPKRPGSQVPPLFTD